MCENHVPVQKEVEYCFSCDEIRFDERKWIPQEKFEKLVKAVRALILLKNSFEELWDMVDSYEEGNPFVPWKLVRIHLSDVKQNIQNLVSVLLLVEDISVEDL